MIRPIGKYRGKVADYGLTESANGKPMVQITFDLVGRYDSASGQLIACEPGKANYYKVVTEKTIPWLTSDLKALGYDKPSLKFLDAEVGGAVNLFGKEVDLECKHEAYLGSNRERWSMYQERARKKVTVDKLAMLDAQFGDQMKKAFGSTTQASAPVLTPNTSDQAE